MLIIIIALLILTSIIIISLGKPKRSVVAFLMYLSYVVMLFGLLIYFLKVGGFSVGQKSLLFGTRIFTAWLTSLPISLENISLLVIIGRLAFAYLFLVELTVTKWSSEDLFKRRPYMYVVIALPLVAATIITTPKVFVSLFAFEYALQNRVVLIVNILIYIYLAAACLIHVKGIHESTLSIYRNRNKMIFISRLCLLATYIFFASFEPVSIYQYDAKIGVKYGFMSLGGKSAVDNWIIVLSFCILSVIITLYYSWRYYKFDYDMAKNELVIKQRVDSVSGASSMLIHGLKNQLLSAEILGIRLEKEISEIKDESVVARISPIAERLNDTNKYMLDRLNVLYQSILNVNIVLSPVTSEDFIESVKRKVEKKYPDFTVNYSVKGGVLLADRELLSEAVYNVIINAIEATVNSKEPKVSVALEFLRARTAIRIIDNGAGISKDLKNKIFTPFTTSKNTKTNWGLGLCYAYNIVKKHAGEIRYDSDKSGTAFNIFLPLYRGKL